MSFDWQNVLKRDGSRPIPEELFLHVEASLSNGIKSGMLLEAVHKNNPDVYWIAEITMVCGHLLRIKYIGADSDFWCDLTKIKVHPLGWCGKYDELIEPPDEINEKYGDSIIDIMKKALIDGMSVSVESLNNNGLSPMDRINKGMKVEVQCSLDPFRFWIATIIDNVGGRLLLNYDGSDNDLEKFSIFFTNSRICHYGFVTSKGSPWHYKYPGKVNKFSCKSKLSNQLKICAEDAIKNPTPADLFQPKFDYEMHNFIVGMKLEAFDPVHMDVIKPATVVKVFNSYQFLAALDDHLNDYEETKMAWLCDALHPYIYPIGWATKHSIKFVPPETWANFTTKDFDWDEYLTMTSSVPVPKYCFKTKVTSGYVKENMKLEAINPEDSLIYAASVEKVLDHLICVKLLANEKKIWFSKDSENIFPVGWCNSNDHELIAPDTETLKQLIKDDVTEHINKITQELWCEKLFFNYKCYSGPMISRNKLSQLPKHVGPGPFSLVLKEVLNMIISVAYKPAKMLRDWEWEDSPEDGMQLEILKAKLKTNTYHAPVQIPTTMEQVPIFCQEICSKLNACPYLFGLVEFSEQCPEKCQQADKSKFQTKNDSTERRGRPKGSYGKKKKKKQQTKAHEPNLDYDNTKEQPESGNDSDNVSSHHSDVATRPNSPDSEGSKIRKINGSFTKSDIQTRGTKQPNFEHKIKGDWNKNVETIYTNTCEKRRSNSIDSDNGNTNSSNSIYNKNPDDFSDFSDSEEPELKKLKLSPAHDQVDRNYSKYLFQNSNSPLHWMRDFKLYSNPLKWSVNDVYEYFNSTKDCKILAQKLKEEEIDGQALALLDLDVLQEFLHMRTKYAVLLFKHINKIKWYFTVNYDNKL